MEVKLDPMHVIQSLTVQRNGALDELAKVQAAYAQLGQEMEELRKHCAELEAKLTTH